MEYYAMIVNDRMVAILKKTCYFCVTSITKPLPATDDSIVYVHPPGSFYSQGYGDFCIQRCFHQKRDAEPRPYIPYMMPMTRHG